MAVSFEVRKNFEETTTCSVSHVPVPHKNVVIVVAIREGFHKIAPKLHENLNRA